MPDCLIRKRYGKIENIEIKSPSRPPAFAFITFEDERDAEDAVRGRDGYDYKGDRLRVEWAKAERRGLRDYDRGRDADWQDLKDFFRKSGDVVYADVKGRGEGIVQYSNGSDMRHAIRTLDDTEMK